MRLYFRIIYYILYDDKLSIYLLLFIVFVKMISTTLFLFYFDFGYTKNSLKL